MEIIKRTRTIEEVVGYKSKDGKEFATKEECEKWEKSAKGVLMDMYKSLEHLGRISEQDLLYLGGCDDYFYDIVKPNSVADIEILNRFIKEYSYGTSRVITADYIGKELLISESDYDGYIGYCTTFDEVQSKMTEAYNRAKERGTEN